MFAFARARTRVLIASTVLALGAIIPGGALLAVAVAMTMWSGYEFFRDVWRQRSTLRAT